MNPSHFTARVAGVVAATLSLASCKVGPEYRPPELDLPTEWNSPVADGLAAERALSARWWETFDDATLTALIERAESGNFGVKVALQRIEESRALHGVARGDHWPDIDATGSYRRLRTSRNGTNNNVSGFQFEDRDLWEVGGELSWEIDLWGRVRRVVEAAKAEVEASIEDYRDVLVMLQAEVATSYVEARLLQEQIAVLDTNVSIQQRTLQQATQRFEADLAPEIDVTQARTALQATRADLPRLRARLRLAKNRLAVLLGEHPGSVDGLLDAGAATIPAVADQIGVQVAGDVVRQRPDVRAAERRLAAATARIGVATADLYPRFSLFGSWSWESVDLDQLFEADSEAFSFGPSVRWNLFHGGRLRAAIDVEDARTAQALLDYERTVLIAIEEVEASLTTHVHERERLADLREAVGNAERSVELSAQLYQSGVTDYDRVLDAQAALLTVQDLEVRTRAALTRNAVQLFRAFGGGWQMPPAAPAAADG